MVYYHLVSVLNIWDLTTFTFGMISVAGLNAAAYMARQWEEHRRAESLRTNLDFMDAIVSCLQKVAGKMRKPVMPATPYRRPTVEQIFGCRGYPLQLWAEKRQVIAYRRSPFQSLPD